jgi:hypothetical protein
VTCGYGVGARVTVAAFDAFGEFLVVSGAPTTIVLDADGSPEWAADVDAGPDDDVAVVGP